MLAQLQISAGEDYQARIRIGFSSSHVTAPLVYWGSERSAIRNSRPSPDIAGLEELANARGHE